MIANRESNIGVAVMYVILTTKERKNLSDASMSASLRLFTVLGITAPHTIFAFARVHYWSD